MPSEFDRLHTLPLSPECRGDWGPFCQTPIIHAALLNWNSAREQKNHSSHLPRYSGFWISLAAMGLESLQLPSPPVLRSDWSPFSQTPIIHAALLHWNSA